MGLEYSKNMFIELVCRNNDAVIENGEFKNWNKAATLYNILSALEFKEFNRKRKTTKEEKYDILNECKEKQYIKIIWLNKRIRIPIISCKGVDYMRMSEFDKYLEDKSNELL